MIVQIAIDCSESRVEIWLMYDGNTWEMKHKMNL